MSTTPSAAPRILSTRDGYDLWAEIYDTEQNPLILLEEPEVKRHLGDVRGLAVADVGCGTGRHAVRLAAERAHVTALDFSEGMIGRAKAKATVGDISFVVHDIATPLPLADRSMDRVINCLVLDHVPTARLEALFRELGRICKRDGFIVVSVMHPAMMLRGVQARFTDPKTGQETRPESSPNVISDYVMGALGAGLRVLHLSEHAVGDELASSVPRAAKYLGWPVLFMMKLAPGDT
ncbi:methyltransferase domain-containing protein [Pendulispora brunnea]|uniref:Methyltransferase domain-containing protein n=1 Tax=Pendulispora brunnea TaxID=2905690 RepID=A0ABZ2KHZ0_9BACT